MKKFKVKFLGRTRGAIGITYSIQDEFECAIEQLGSAIYRKYELISLLYVNGEYFPLSKLQFSPIEP